MNNSSLLVAVKLALIFSGGDKKKVVIWCFYKVFRVLIKGTEHLTIAASHQSSPVYCGVNTFPCYCNTLHIQQRGTSDALCVDWSKAILRATCIMCLGKLREHNSDGDTLPSTWANSTAWLRLTCLSLSKRPLFSLCRETKSTINFEVYTVIKQRKVSQQWHDVSINGQTKWSGEGQTVLCARHWWHSGQSTLHPELQHDLDHSCAGDINSYLVGYS